MRPPIQARKVFVQPGRGMPLPTVHKHTVTPSPYGFMPHTYSREVRRPWTGEELRALRKQRGVGQVRRIMPAERIAA